VSDDPTPENVHARHAAINALEGLSPAWRDEDAGSRGMRVLPELLAPPREHATTIVGPGDVGFLTVEKGSGYGIEEAYSEVCWFYDLDATPSMPEGPIAVNVFARLYDADAFFAVCRRMRLEGAKRLEIARAEK
jgi:hypothetical protein